MAKNKGKQFEDVIKKSLLNVPDVSVDRLRDAPKQQKNVDNPADFVVYKKPYEIYLECKTHKGNTLPFSCVRDVQIKGLTEKSKLDGVIAGLLIWFIDHDATVFVPISTVNQLIEEGAKSINYFHILNRKHYWISGKKKRVYFDYDMEKFLQDLITHKEGENGKV